MPRRRPELWAAAAALAFIAAIPAIGQEGPESLLPEGFGDPVPATPAPTPSAPVAGDVPVVPLNPAAPGAPLLSAGELAALNGEEVEEEPEEPEYDVPVRRNVDFVGPLGPGEPGMGSDAFGNSDGRFLSALMRAVDAPIASRWASIMLRRALLSQTPTPRGVVGADWVAERAWLLLRMGEADAARMLVDSVDVDRFSPKLLSVTAQTALANSDPAALCPLTEIALTMSEEPIWPMARAACAALQADPATARSLVSAARRGRNGARGIDLLLAEKVVGAGPGGRRAVTIEWDQVDQLTAWRFGMATATGVAIPDRLYETVGPHVRGWAARAPMIAPADRLPAARIAATLGVLSSANLVDLYGQLADRIDVLELEGTDPGRLQTAYVAEDPAARLDAMRALWSAATDPRDRYAAELLTARAATRLPPGTAGDDDLRPIVASLFSAGYDRAAGRWAAAIDDASGDAADRAWSILAVGGLRAPADTGRLADQIEGAGDADARHRAQLLLAAMAAFGRAPADTLPDLATQAGLNLGARDRYIAALEQAARARQPGTVALLAAVGLQTSQWRGVPPHHFRAILAALRAVGLEGDARMIAAEAMSRT